jgi:hemoglobin
MTKAPKQPGEYGYQDTSFRAMGGERGIRSLVDDFYDAMAELPEASGIFAMHRDVAESRDKLAAFLSGWLGGPRTYQERWGAIAIPLAHQHLPIGTPERNAWMACMTQAAARAPISDDFRRYFLREIAVPADRVVAVRARTQAEKPKG